eukprot:1183091-Amphidinium_carterae.1
MLSLSVGRTSCVEESSRIHTRLALLKGGGRGVRDDSFDVGQWCEESNGAERTVRELTYLPGGDIQDRHNPLKSSKPTVPVQPTTVSELKANTWDGCAPPLRPSKHDTCFLR